jgi:hypothetical protein
MDALDTPPLLQAVHATVATIEARARLHRWAVVSVAMTLIIPLLVAAIAVSWRPLPWVALLVPAVGSYLVVDSRTVLRWQRRVLNAWLAGDLGLGDLRQTLAALRHLPRETVLGMLDRLPAAGAGREPDQLHAAGRASAVEAALNAVHRQDRRTVLSAAGATLVACSLAAALTVPARAPLLVIPVGFLLMASSRISGSRDRGRRVDR